MCLYSVKNRKTLKCKVQGKLQPWWAKCHRWSGSTPCLLFSMISSLGKSEFLWLYNLKLREAWLYLQNLRSLALHSKINAFPLTLLNAHPLCVLSSQAGLELPSAAHRQMCVCVSARANL